MMGETRAERHGVYPDRSRKHATEVTEVTDA
jgi:hypothetical protein